ncbi:MAG: zf-HC2 domain-containing protein [Planctomycetes bacterium]|nr:zf-HC2 domain-containing protein [Planctomycetota bacterium]MBI3844306.1 zf-HC2 domain-containing protein [Planctomycetota bacterium]
MACEVNGPDLSAYADGELSPEHAERIRAHVLLCDECRATLDAWGAAGDLLRASEAGDDEAAVRASIHAAVREGRRARAPRLSRRVRWLLAAAAALVLVAPALFFGQALATSRQAREVVSLEGQNRVDASAQVQDVDALQMDLAAVLVHARAAGLDADRLEGLERQAQVLAEESERLRARLLQIDDRLRKEGLLRDDEIEKTRSNRPGEPLEVGSESTKR